MRTMRPLYIYLHEWLGCYGFSCTVGRSVNIQSSHGACGIGTGCLTNHFPSILPTGGLWAHEVGFVPDLFGVVKLMKYVLFHQAYFWICNMGSL